MGDLFASLLDAVEKYTKSAITEIRYDEHLIIIQVPI